MTDIRSPWLLYLKGGLLLIIGLVAAGILLVEHPSIRFALLLAVAVWGFVRAYYFAFYVIEHYIDPGFRYAGLFAFLKYLVTGRREPGAEFKPGDAPNSH